MCETKPKGSAPKRKTIHAPGRACNLSPPKSREHSTDPPALRGILKNVYSWFSGGTLLFPAEDNSILLRTDFSAPEIPNITLGSKNNQPQFTSGLIPN